MKTIELIVPCYNEEKCIALLCENVKKVFADMPEYDFIITYIDDGSKDSTLEEIKKVAAVENTGETVRKPLRGDNRILNVGLSPKQS
ncbi:MAG: glycosyltransferase [Lachnospiraceae bacterium]|nr:glycosyltransferase [Lachnospiraceae bacterium]